MNTDTSLENLILDLLQWLAIRPRTYQDVMRDWKTSCPRFPVWEEAVDRGFVERGDTCETGPNVTLTSEGIAHLRRFRPAS
jgi:hypothetical protein